MNRSTTDAFTIAGAVPHVRGDEPFERCIVRFAGDLFPTCVGMNRKLRAAGHRVITCSPRAWG